MGLKVEERQLVADTDIDVVALGRSFCRLISNCTHMSGSMGDLNFETVKTVFLSFNIWRKDIDDTEGYIFRTISDYLEITKN